ncbi:helix-turn-helix transcriptional regulator [Krasilnikovia sp. MM14-A1004]|uniref:helix-turn-helix transcriptional regulator n=1 Tax=Krasilnikovia sp. MM14-A1004 TaxID=3373541 RepID=UPI00399D0C75
MSASVESVIRAVSAAPAQPVTVTEFGAELARQVGRLLPHDGYQIRGLDPGTGVGCLVIAENGYRAATARRLELNEYGGRDLHSLASLVGGRRVGVLGSGEPEERRSERLHDIMAGEGFGAEMRVALTDAGITRGTLTLLRGRDCRAFSAAEAAHAERLATPLAVALRRYVARRPPRPFGDHAAPGVVVVEADDTVRATAATRAWFGTLVPEPDADDDALFGNLWNIVYAARRHRAEALTRIPLGGAWLAMRAQPLDDAEPGAVTVTIQPASADTLLPALAAWYALTPSERKVLGQVRLGLPGKQIATRLGVSPHTVNDHLKSIYRKTGVGARDELLAALSG